MLVDDPGDLDRLFRRQEMTRTWHGDEASPRNLLSGLFSNEKEQRIGFLSTQYNNVAVHVRRPS